MRLRGDRGGESGEVKTHTPDPVREWIEGCLYSAPAYHLQR